MKFPKGISNSQKKYLKEVYENAYALKIKESKTEEKSKAFARARFYEETFKIFIGKEKSVLQTWKSRKKVLKEGKKPKVDYKTYSVDNTSFIVSTDKKILDFFDGAERSGLLKDMNDEYEQEILFKAKKQYGVTLHPDMYYVIK